MNERLEELEKKYKELGAEIERLQSKPEPKLGDLCYFSNFNSKDVIGILDAFLNIGEEDRKYQMRGSSQWWKHIEKCPFQPNDISLREALDNPESILVDFLSSDKRVTMGSCLLDPEFHHSDNYKNCEIRRKSDT